MRRMGLLVWLTAGPALSGWAETELSLQEAIALALRPGGQTQMVNAEIERELAEARVALQRSTTALAVNAGVTETVLRFDLRSVGIDLPEASPFVVNVNLQPVVGPFTLLDMRVFATKPLVNRSAAWQLAAAREGVAVARENGRLAQSQIVSETVKAYLSALLAQESDGQARMAVAHKRKQVETAQERQAQGVGTGGEVRRARLALQASEQKQVAAATLARVARLQLQAWIGRRSGEERLVPPLESGAGEMGTVEQAREQALARRPELEVYRAQLKQIRSSAQAIAAQRLPTLTAFGNVGGLSSAPTPNGTAMASLSYTFAGGVTLRVPVLDGGRRAAQFSEVELRRRAIENAHHGMLKRVELEVAVAVEKLRGAREQWEALVAELPLWNEELEQAREFVRAGEATAAEMREVESRREEALYQRTVAWRELQLARLALGEATGTVLEMAW